MDYFRSWSSPSPWWHMLLAVVLIPVAGMIVAGLGACLVVWSVQLVRYLTLL